MTAPDDAGPPAQGPAAKTPLTLFVVIAVLAAAAIAAAVGLVSVMDSVYAKAERADVTEISETGTPAPYFVDVRVRVAGVDLDRETVSLQLECIPTGRDLFADSSAVPQIKYPITLTLGISEAGTQETVVFSGPKVGGIANVDLDLTGNVQQYPTDRHTATLWLRAFRQARGLDPDPMPVRLAGYGAWPGLDVKLAAPPSTGEAAFFAPRQLHLAIERSHATSVVVYFSIVLTWILIVSVIGMTVSVLFSRKTSELGMLAFFGTLLFAMTAFRNALPGAPPMGARSDYLAFFWGYGVAIVAIGVVAADWLRRRTKDERR